ncbi:uncharacterized protein PV06_11779 [Exophiala oligosperma]|uniref:Uncharacterized protein n=1 Tax=Exophiala oligosperma TaxID=215243 RepID=A0A0D2BEI6_9EURO|nr:uncharacterized protein PV06_11779 [Exophiala oligosperma]KIW35907.1 hypothetical protein PV06_11779 [Exophiala oligosperma]
MKSSELANTAAYIFCSAQRPPYENRFDFFTLHGLTPTVHFPAFLEHPAFPPTGVARLVEYLGRVIIALYAGIGCPEPELTYALSHVP